MGLDKLRKKEGWRADRGPSGGGGRKCELRGEARSVRLE